MRKGLKIMTEEYPIVFVEKIDDSIWGAIGGGIQKFNLQHGGEEHYQRLCFVVYAPDQEIIGGVIGATYWNWCFIDLMWVKEELRGRGYGQHLLMLAEDEARKRGAQNVYLDTFSFQAPDFYKKQGYRVFGELQDFPPGHQRYFLTKPL
jgi:GNAT superfamily N-acetyltransferase